MSSVDGESHSHFMKEIDLTLLAFPTLKLLCTSSVMSCQASVVAEQSYAVASHCAALHFIV